MDVFDIITRSPVTRKQADYIERNGLPEATDFDDASVIIGNNMKKMRRLRLEQEERMMVWGITDDFDECSSGWEP